MKKCPKCGNNHFFVSAHVVQDWKVDENGNFLETINECSEVTHTPDDEDIWTCSNCNYSDEGKLFNVTK